MTDNFGGHKGVGTGVVVGVGAPRGSSWGLLGGCTQGRLLPSRLRDCGMGIASGEFNVQARKVTNKYHIIIFTTTPALQPIQQSLRRLADNICKQRIATGTMSHESGASVNILREYASIPRSCPAQESNISRRDSARDP